MEVEIEWEAKQTDGFATRTFEDLDKLDAIDLGEWGMFLAVNIGNKYKRADPKRVTVTRDPTSFAPKPTTVLAKKWKHAKNSFWRWNYDKTCDVTVLTCFGKRTRNGWTS